MRLILSLFKMSLMIFIALNAIIFVIGFTASMEKHNIGNSYFNFLILTIISIVITYKIGKFILSIGKETQESIF